MRISKSYELLYLERVRKPSEEKDRKKKIKKTKLQRILLPVEQQG